ncbi:hypothetical protein V8E53_008329 [Lactarius tabidus]
MPWKFPPLSIHSTQPSARVSHELQPEVSETGASNENGNTAANERRTHEAATHTGSLTRSGTKRKLPDSAVQDAGRLSKRVTRRSHEPGLSNQMVSNLTAITAMAEASQLQSDSSIAEGPVKDELRKTEELLLSALQENEGLHAQIRTLHAKNEQLTTWLCDLQTLADTLKRLVDDAVQDTQ